MSISAASQQDIMSRQMDMFRLARRDHDLTANRLSKLSRIPETTIQSWCKGSAMPAWALVVLSAYLPDELTSLMFEPAARYVGTAEPGDGDLDALAREGADYNVEYLRARDPGSDAGPELSPREKAILRDKARRIAATARRAAA